MSIALSACVRLCAVDPPGKVQHVQISVVPGMHGARAHVTWAPPTDLGSAGAIGYYTVYYGLVDEVWGFGFKDNVFHNITVTPVVQHVLLLLWWCWWCWWWWWWW